MRVIAIDPGPEQSGVVVLDAADGEWPPHVLSSGVLPTTEMLWVVGTVNTDAVVCEWLTTYGATMGASVLDTARVVGRIEQEAHAAGVGPTRHWLLTRPEVCHELCQRRSAKKSETRAALIEMFPPTGGGKTPQVGTKKQPGPLYGITAHAWDALAVGVAWLRMNRERGMA